ncbi:MAG: enoyl-CoA hydratase/isomerase family protein [Legionellales bacterium]|nr:enoyl-CoA hydratase/isomerase family protein [Legionellales bacterium]
MSDPIVFARVRHIGLITLNRPEALNALTLDMIHQLQHHLEEYLNDSDIHAVVLMAAPGKAFCAGGDVRWLYEAGPEDTQKQMQFFWHEYRLNHFIHNYTKPYISLMDGVTMGGGVGISLHGSHPIATERFMFAMPETGIGFFPDIGASYLLSRCPGQIGMYLGLTGHRLGMNDARALGLVKFLISSDKIQEALSHLIFADLSEDAFAAVDRCLMPVVLSAGASSLLAHQVDIDACFEGADVESIVNRLAVRTDKWSQETSHILEKKSPISLKVTADQLKKAKVMSMADCIKMDYCLAGHFMRGHDFYEGVRALLVDKDKLPQWQPDLLSKVTKASVEDYFHCGQPGLPFLNI